MTAKETNKLVGIFLMAHGSLQAFAMVILCLVYGGMGIAMLLAGRHGEEKIVGLVFLGMIILIAIIAVVLVGPQIIGGYKLFKEKPGARNWGVIASIISCISFPLGTAAGIFGLVFLFGDEGKLFYLGGGPQPAFNISPQPPVPNSWQ